MTTAPLVGRRYERPEARAKASGRLRYVSDLQLEGMLDAAVVRSPFPRARVRSIDASEAESLLGFVGILTAGELEGVRKGKAFPDSPAIQTVLTNEPMFVGDAVAAVVAADRETALEAAKLVFVDYEELPALLSPEDALRGELQLYPEAPGNLAGPPVEFEYGDFESAIGSAERVFVDQYATQRQCAQTIEPMGCIARWDERGRVEVFTHLDNVFHLREQMAHVLGLADDRIRVLSPEALGATFGLKNGLLASLEPLCALLARKVAAPVRLLLTPEESMTTTVTRHPATIRLTTGIDANGRLVARSAEVLLDSGASGFGYIVVRSMASKWATLYPTPNLRFDGRAVYTNQVPCGAYRGVGTAQIHFALESQIDDIARALGADPVDYRLSHVVHAGAVLPGGTPIRAFGVDQCIERGSTAIGWRDRPRTRSSGRYLRGMGMALGMHHSGVTNIIPGITEQSACRASLAADGCVVLEIAAVDKGQGALSTLAAVAAETLALPLDAVRLEPIDSEKLPYDALGAEASRSTYVMGRAVAAAAGGLRAKLLDRAARVLGRPAEQLELASGEFRHRDGGSVALAELFSADGEQLFAEGRFEPQDGDPLPVIGADFCEVEVDRLTGQVEVLRFVAAQDVGCAINVLGCEGQIEGGIHHGVGYALLEELVLEHGQPLNGNFAGYRVLMAPDMPEVQPILVEEPDDEGGPFGAKGLGTGVIPAIAPAVCNAIRDATGVRPTKLPVTPARLLALLEGGTAVAEAAVNDEHAT